MFQSLAPGLQDYSNSLFPFGFSNQANVPNPLARFGSQKERTETNSSHRNGPHNELNVHRYNQVGLIFQSDVTTNFRVFLALTVLTAAVVMSTTLYLSFYVWVIPTSVQTAPIEFKL